jgi:hypothetical protein
MWSYGYGDSVERWREKEEGKRERAVKMLQ